MEPKEDFLVFANAAGGGGVEYISAAKAESLPDNSLESERICRKGGLILRLPEDVMTSEPPSRLTPMPRLWRLSPESIMPEKNKVRRGYCNDFGMSPVLTLLVCLQVI